MLETLRRDAGTCRAAKDDSLEVSRIIPVEIGWCKTLNRVYFDKHDTPPFCLLCRLFCRLIYFSRTTTPKSPRPLSLNVPVGMSPA